MQWYQPAMAKVMETEAGAKAAQQYMTHVWNQANECVCVSYCHSVAAECAQMHARMHACMAAWIA